MFREISRRTRIDRTAVAGQVDPDCADGVVARADVARSLPDPEVGDLLQALSTDCPLAGPPGSGRSPGTFGSSGRNPGQTVRGRPV